MRPDFPKQRLSYKSKNKKWRESNVDWADNRTIIFNDNLRRTLYEKKINYDLVNGIIYKEDILRILNPGDRDSREFVPNDIQHYPIINNPINTLLGEEARRRFDFKIVATNPNAISEIETKKKIMFLDRIQELIEDPDIQDEQFQEEIKKHTDFLNYEWQDIRELRANYLVQHYIKELEFKKKWSQGFENRVIAAEEVYQIDSVQGEPTFEVINPKRIFGFGMGYSGKFEDADVIVIEDYWNPGRVVDHFYDKLKPADIDYLEETYQQFANADDMDNLDPRNNFIRAEDFTGEGNLVEDFLFAAGTHGFRAGEYYDNNGNIRVLQVYWKSKRKVYKLKRFDPETGETIYDFVSESYKPNKALGEEVKAQWINEAWEGTKVGKDIYLNIKPRDIQFNRLENPSRCHFGIIGDVDIINDSRASSLVDRMKPYQYLYDVIKDKLNTLIAKNLGRVAQLDLAKIPEKWDVKTWLYYIKKDGISFYDSFKEGNFGNATGKLAGNFSNQTGVLDLDTGNNIQQYIGLLQFIEQEMENASGISKQRQGQISNRETVGGVERAVAQSSNITERMFARHDDVKKRTLACLIEVAKLTLKGKSKKLRYIADDSSIKLMEIPGEEFSEMDYGIIVDTDSANIELEQKLDQLAHAALQNQLLDFSTIMEIYSNPSLSSIKRIIQKNEKQVKEEQAQEAQQQRQVALQQVQANQEIEQQKMAAEETRNIRDNETKILLKELELQMKMTERKEGDNQEEIDKFKEELQIKKDQLNETIRSNKAKESIARMTKKKQ